jgi:hypothetical protein
MNRYIEAFKETHNAGALAAITAVSCATLSITPLLAGIVAEAAYLLFVPDTRWYKERLDRRQREADRKKLEELEASILGSVSAEVAQRYHRMKRLRENMNGMVQGDERWFADTLKQLDCLLHRYLQFAAKEEAYRTYLNGLHVDAGSSASATQSANTARQVQGKRNGRNSPADSRSAEDTTERVIRAFEEELTDVRAQVEAEQDPSTQSVLQKRLEVLEKRREYVQKAFRTLINLRHQMQLFEDTFALINDELSVRSPEQILAEVEQVVMSTDTMMTALEEINTFESAYLGSGSGS